MTAESARALLPQLTSIGRVGLGAFVEQYRGGPDALLKRLRGISLRGAHPSDTPAQSLAIEAIFNAGAHERTVAFAAATRFESRARAREFLALYLVELARGLLAALEEEGSRSRGVLDQFRAPCGAAFSREWPVAYAGSRWASLRLAPLFAVLHVSAASGNGPEGLINEFSAANRRVIELALRHDAGSFVGALFHSGLCQRKLCELAGQQGSAAQWVASLQRAVVAFDGMSMQEREAFREVVAAAANAAAAAARERVLFSRGWQLEDEGWALQDIQRLIVWPAAVRPAISSPSA